MRKGSVSRDFVQQQKNSFFKSIWISIEQTIMLQFVSISSKYWIAKFENSETLRSQKCMLSDPQAKKSTCVCFELWNRISSRNCIGANIECFKQKNMGRKSHDTVTLRPTSNLHRFYILTLGRKSHDTVTLRPTSNLHRFYILTLLCHVHCTLTVHTMCNFWKIRISRQIEPSSQILYNLFVKVPYGIDWWKYLLLNSRDTLL